MTKSQALETTLAGACCPPTEMFIRPGVSFPDWSVATSDAARVALGSILKAIGAESRWSNLTEAEDIIRREVLGLYAELGRAPSIKQLSMSTGIAAEDIRRLLGKLQDRDMVVFDKSSGTLSGAYPFTDNRTGHRVRLGKREFNAMCAIDALGIGAMLDGDTVIETTCRQCRHAIRIETKNSGWTVRTVSPEGAIVWSGIQDAGGCAANTHCTVMAFFCSDDHLATWRTENAVTGAIGHRLSIDEGLQTGIAIFLPFTAQGPVASPKTTRGTKTNERRQR